MSVPEIRELNAVLAKHIGDKTVVETNTTRLTAPGENFGSEILKVEVVLKTRDGSEEKHHLVAKLIPRNDILKTVFNVQVSFKCEKGFYDTIVPTLQDFQRRQGVKNVMDMFPKLYGARYNLNDDANSPIDDDAVLILENLQIKGYANVDRFIGFDLELTKIFLKYLAEFHATPVALKYKDPQTFQSKIVPFMAYKYPTADRSAVDNSAGRVYEILEVSASKQLPKLKKSMQKSGQLRRDFKEPFATLVHRDLWGNNIMVKLSDDVPVDFKFVDFQMYSYDTPAADLFFFLFTSVQTQVLQGHLDELLLVYQQHFAKVLRELGCDLTFTYEDLIKEIINCAEWTLGSTIFMFLFIIQAKRGQQQSEEELPNFKSIIFDDKSVEKVIWILQECDKRGWLKF